MDKRRFLPIFATVFTNLLGAGVILPILPLLAEGEYGASAFEATLLAAVYFAAQFVAAPWLGRLSDRFGRRPILIVSQIGTVFSFVLFVLAGPWGSIIDNLDLGLSMSGGLLILYLARLLDGITGGNITTARAYVTDISTEEARAQALGALNAAFGLGFIFGPAFGGALAEINLVAPFVGAAVITSGSVLLTIFLLKESLPPEERTSMSSGQVEEEKPLYHFLRDHTILLILIINFVVTLSFSALQSTFALYAERVIFPSVNQEIVARNVGFILAFVGVVLVITQLFLIKPLVNRWGERNLVLFGQLSLAVTFVGLSIVSSALWVTLFIVPVAVGNGVSQPSLQSLITRFSDRKTRGRLLGLFQSAFSLALIIGPIWSGYVFETIQPRAPYIIAIPMLILSFALSLLLKRRSIPTSQAVPS